MPLTLEEFNGMELIWDQLSKKGDSRRVSLTLDEIDSMWDMGIVDTEQFPLSAWRSAFDEHKDADGTYSLSREEFLAKEPYRYKGEIMVPFDALLINEGKYTDEGFQELIDLSIGPSCSLPPAELKDAMEGIKAGHRQPDGLIAVDMRTKSEIKKVIDENPSPLRRLELLFDAILKEEMARAGQPATVPYSVSPEQLARLQASSFSMTPTSDVERKGIALRALEKKVSKRPTAEDRPTTTVKKVKRSRKGLRG